MQSSAAQQFECSEGLTLEHCRQEMLVLKNMLGRYGASELGEWKWVLVRSENWKLFLAERGFSSMVPALTSLEAKATFFDDALVVGSSGRISELMDVWHVGRDGLLDLAVRHELGHVLCKDGSEWKADRAARLLEQGKPVTCAAARLRKGNKGRK